jgi:hypothetical protein
MSGGEKAETMFEDGESGQRDESGDDEMTHSPKPGHPVAGEDVGTPEEGAGRAKAEATPEIEDEDQVKEQTAHSAPDDDVGAPPHEGGV